ncbi:hypothetical protein ACTXT7_002411 [Hymenolepis weldensis]
MNVQRPNWNQFNFAEKNVRTSIPAIDVPMTATRFLVLRFYPPSTVELDGIGTCELTANEGHNFCPLGPMDCLDSPFGPKCRSEVETSLIDASPKYERFKPSAPLTKSSPVELDLLIRKAFTDKNLTYLVQKSIPLLWENSNEWIQTFSNITKGNAHRSTSSLFESRNEVSSENLLQSVETLLDLQTQRQTDIKNYRPLRGQTAKSIPQISASTVVQSASALMNVFSALTGDQDSLGLAKNGADEYTIQRNGLELRCFIRAISVGGHDKLLLRQGDLIMTSPCPQIYLRIRINRNQSYAATDSIELQCPSNSTGVATCFPNQSTALMITIPVRKLEPFLKKSNNTDLYADSENKSPPSMEASFINLDSDVYIVHSSDLISLFRLKLASKDERKEDATCRIWDMLNANECLKNDFAAPSVSADTPIIIWG